MLDAYIYVSLRSPIGRHAGELAGLRSDELARDVIATVSPCSGAGQGLAVVLERKH